MSAKKPETTTITAVEAMAAFDGTWYPVAFHQCFFCDSRGCAKCDGRGSWVENLQPVTAETRARVLTETESLLSALDPDAKA